MIPNKSPNMFLIYVIGEKKNKKKGEQKPWYKDISKLPAQSLLSRSDFL